MNRFPALRRTVLALATLGACCLAGPLSAAQAAPLNVVGTFTLTSLHDRDREGVLEGRANPGGRFSGEFAMRLIRPGVLEGVAKFDFGGGSLLIAFHVELDAATEQVVGTFVIIDGTGAFSGATGGGDMIADHGMTGEWALRGTIDK